MRAEQLTVSPTVGNEANVSAAWRASIFGYQCGYIVKATVTKAPSGGGSNIVTSAHLSGVQGHITDTVHEVTWHLEGTVTQMAEDAFGDNWGTATWGL